MDKILGFLLFLVIQQLGISQKLIEKEIVNPETKVVIIDVVNCFQVNLRTHRGKQLTIEASMEGEYAQDLSIELEEQGSNIMVGTNFLPSFNAPNDKLSAHKVISILLSVSLPEYMQVEVYGTHSNVSAKGKYKDLSVTLADGSCSFDSVLESVHAKTQKGEITINNAKGTIDAKSDYGQVDKGAILQGQGYFNLYSVEGNILVNKN